MKKDDIDYKAQLGMTLQDIGNLLGCSREAVRKRLMGNAEDTCRLHALRFENTQLREQVRELRSRLAALLPQQEGTPRSAPTDRHYYDMICTHSARALSVFQRLGLNTLLEVHTYGVRRLATEPNIGGRTLRFIKTALTDAGYTINR